MRAARGWFAQVRAKPPCFLTLVFIQTPFVLENEWTWDRLHPGSDTGQLATTSASKRSV